MNLSRNPYFNVLFSTRFNQNHVNVKWDPAKRKLPINLRQQIDKFWQREIEQTEKDKFIFNGELCRLNSWQLQDSSLTLNLGRTCYKELLYSNQFNKDIEKRYGSTFLSKALGINVVLVSCDEKIVLIKRSDKVGEFPGRVDVIGGHIEPTEHCSLGTPNPFFAIKEEIREELNLKIKKTEQLNCIGLIETTATKKLELIFKVKSEYPKANILERASKRRCSEIAELFTVANERSALRTLLTTRRDEMSPSACGVLCLYDQFFEV